MSIATVDFEKFRKGTAEEKKAAADQVANSLRATGFVKLVNSGIPTKVIRDSERWSYKFFHESPKIKAKVLNVPSPKPQRGWSYKGAESTARLGKLELADHEFLTDEKEHYDFGPVGDVNHPNKWNEEDFPGFQAFTMKFYDYCQTLGLQIMEAIEVSCEFAPGCLQNRCQPASSELRYNHYPSVDVSKIVDGKTRRAWPHTDFGLITLLFQDMQGGLQYEDRGKEDVFLDLLRQSDDEVAVNISDTFQRWSNDFFPAGVHQVWLPPACRQPGCDKLPERQSTVFFFKAHFNQSVGALPEFITADRTSRYEDITALEYQKRMTEVLVKNASAPEASAEGTEASGKQ